MRIFGSKKGKKVLKRPSVEIVDDSVLRVPEYGLEFTSDLLGKNHFAGLKNSDYEEGFNMASFPNLIRLVYAIHLNKDSDFQPDSEVRGFSENFVKKLEDRCMTGNTAVLRGQSGMYVWDNPVLDEENFIYAPKDMDSALKKGAKRKGKVLYSEENKFRNVSYDSFEQGKNLSYQDFVNNVGIQALVRGENNASKLWEVFKNYKIGRFIDKGDESYLHGNEVRIPELKFEDRGNLATLKGHGSQILPYYSAVGVRKSG